MLYPTIKQYIDALRLAEDNFDQLASYRIVTGVDGNPVMSSGNFAVVFKMQDSRDGSFHAVKCFLKDQPGRAEAYHLIAEELEQVTSSYLAHIRFLERELFVDTGNGGDEYPVLVMDWVEGINLDRYLRQHISDPYALGMLAYHFARLGAWLFTQPFAHGDLKPDNILVRPDGTLVLVDYDGMYVPAMQGQRALETGTPDFRHPLRTDSDFNEHIDDFPLASILLSLRAVAHCPDYLNRYGATDRLLLSEADYRSPEKSAFLRNEFPTPDAELNRIYSLFLIVLKDRTLSQVSSLLFELQKPFVTPPMNEENTSPATKEEIDKGVEDEFGVVYSRDGKQLLKCKDHNIIDYHVHDGCLVIRGEAFDRCISLTSIIMPTSITLIGDYAFWMCKKLTLISLSFGLTYIGKGAFRGCKSLTVIILPASLIHIGDSAFSDTGIGKIVSQSPHFTFTHMDGGFCLVDNSNKRLISACSNIYHIVLPTGLTDIGDCAFSECFSLTSITLPESLTHIGNFAFYWCNNLTAITLPTNLEKIGDGAFSKTRIRNVTNHSPYFSFINGCLIDNLKHKLLSYLSDQPYVVLPTGLTHIGINAFSECNFLTTAILPTTLTHIEDQAFDYCKNLTSITLPIGLSYVGDRAFRGCDLKTINLNSGLTHIGDGAFALCSSLTAITLPASLTHIGDWVFAECNNLSHIYIPKGMMAHFKNLLEPKYHSIIVEEVIANNVTTEKMFIVNRREKDEDMPF